MLARHGAGFLGLFGLFVLSGWVHAQEEVAAEAAPTAQESAAPASEQGGNIFGRMFSPGAADKPVSAFDPAAAIKTPAEFVSLSKEFGGTRRVLVPTFRVVFATKAKGSASASRLGASGSANVHGSYTLAGINDAQLQAITDVVFKRFVDTLRAGGVEVITFTQLPEAQQARLREKVLPAPVRFSYLKRDYAVFTPAGLPFYAGMGEPVQEAYGFGGKLSHIGWAAVEYVEGNLAAENQATLVRPTFWVEFIDVETSGNMFSGRASVSGEPGLKITQAQTSMRVIPHTVLVAQPKPTDKAQTLWVPADWNFMGLPSMGLIRTIQPADSGVVAINNTTDTAMAVVQTALNVLGAFAGAGGRKDVSYDVVVDPARYSAASEQSLGAVAQMWAQLLVHK